ncbi:MAG: hypothetical protein WCG95_02875, partial [bacterium]
QSEVLDKDVSQIVLKEVQELAKNWNFDDEDALHHTLEELRTSLKERSIKPKETMWAIRAAVTGRVKGADICAVLSILGKEKVLKRIQNALRRCG